MEALFFITMMFALAGLMLTCLSVDYMIKEQFSQASLKTFYAALFVTLIFAITFVIVAHKLFK